MSLATQVSLLTARVGAEFKAVRSFFGAPTTAVRKGYYSFGGATNTGTFTATSQAERTRFQLSRQPSRMRLHVRNYLGLSDFAPTGTGPTMTGVYIGQQSASASTPWDYRSAPIQMGVAAGAPIQGLTEYVSDWWNPTWDLTAIPSLLSVGYTLPANATNIVYGNGSHSITINDATKVNAVTVGTIGGGESATSWYDYNYTVLEMWIEYEFVDDGTQVGLAMGHSLTDGTQFSGGLTPAWDGQGSAWPQKVARRTDDVVVVNAFATSKTSDWVSTSTKWSSRFTDLNPDWIVVDITANDVMNTSLTAAQIDTNLRGILVKARTMYPNARIYVATCVPILPGYTGSDAAAKEVIRQSVNQNIGALPDYLVDGVFDFEKAVAKPRVTTVGTGTPAAATYTVAYDTYDPALVGADGQHANSRGHDCLADAVSIPGPHGAAGTVLGSVWGAPIVAPVVGSYFGPQGVTNTAVANVTALNTLWVVPYMIGPKIAQQVDAVAFQVTTAYSSTATVMNVGVYGSNSDGSPNLAAGPLASGTLSLNAAAVGVKVLTFTAPVTLQPGQVWLVAFLSGTQPTAGQSYCISQTSYSLLSQTGYSSSTGKFLTATASTMPNTAVALTASTAITAPHFMIRRSA